jgi:thioredoxin-related protein
MKGIQALVLLCLLASPGVSQTSSSDSPTAQRLLKNAEALASSRHKTIMLIVSASWCVECHLLESFLNHPSMRPIFHRHFVTLVVEYGERSDDTRHHDTPGADRLLDYLHDKDTGLPLMVILDSSGTPIVDSVRPVYGRRNNHANIGYPETPTGIRWFLEMLRRGAPSLTSNEIETIESWLLQHSKHGHTN